MIEAIQESNYDINSGLLKKKKITALNKRFGTSKKTLLHYAVLAQDTELFKFRLAAKVDVNRTNCCSSTPKNINIIYYCMGLSIRK